MAQSAARRASLFGFKPPWRRSISSYDCEKGYDVCPVDALREALAREAILLDQKEAFVLEQQLLHKESDHRLLNGLQLVVSLLTLQSRAATNPEAAQQLSVAADRVANIERIHRRLHFHDGTHDVAFKQYMVEFCGDFSGMLAPDEAADRVIRVEGAEFSVPTSAAIPLGFIVNELITNAVKYGKGVVCLRLGLRPGKGYSLTVSNDGPALPQGFDPAASKGLGMTIIKSFVRQIGGELIFGRSSTDRGAQFTVLFS
jgi:two-component system, sensor histidine kinase PdtaS